MTTASKRTRKNKGQHAGRLLRIDTELTIYTALASKDLLLTELAAGSGITIDLSAVSEIDTAGLQLLLLTHREASKAGKTLRIAAPSPAVASVLELCCLSWLLETPRAAPDQRERT